jgi:NAD(P)H dehydrogenase (quinone)
VKHAQFLIFGMVTWWCLAGHFAAASGENDHITVLVAYHSMTGHTEKMAEGVAEGAKGVPGTTVTLKRVGHVTAEELFSTDALIVGSPVYWANMAGEVKTFFDNWQFKFGIFPDSKCGTKSARHLRPVDKYQVEKKSPC